MSGGYELHPAAYDDLDGIWEFVACHPGRGCGNLTPPAEAALAFRRPTVALIRAAISNIVPFPHMGHHRDDLTGRPLLFWPVRDYLIAYAPDTRPLWELAILHGRRNPRVIAAILRERD